MSKYDSCPYCDEEIYLEDVCQLSDGGISEGYTVCPHCHKAIMFMTRISVDFYTYCIERAKATHTCQKGISINTLEKMLAYNAKIDECVHTDEEIEQYKNEWWGQ